jgi:hypothetical protein
MSKLLAPLVLAGALLLALAALWPPAPDPMRDYYQMEHTRLQLEQEAADATRWSAFWDVALPLAGVLAGLVVVGALGFAGLALWERRRPLVVIEAIGAPIDRRALHSGAYAQLPYAILEHRTQAAIAAGAGVPHTITYSPHYVSRQDVQGAAPAQLVAPAFTAPAFADLLARGLIGAGAPLLLGYGADGQALTGSWKDLYSSAVAGISGSGKTTTLRFLAGQSALQGARFVLLDPHAEAGDESLVGTLAPLAPAFLCEPASDPRAMLQSLALAREVLQGRLHGEPGPPLIVAIDEFTALQGRSDLAGPMAELIEAIAQEGRKARVFALISGQIWTAQRSGGTALRDSLASAYVHRCKRQTARLLINTEDARRAEDLAPGMALLARNTGEVIDICVPYTTGADMQAVGRLLGQDAAPVPTARPTAGEVAAKPRLTVVRPNWWDDVAATGTHEADDLADLATAPAPMLTPAQKRALACWRAHKTPAEMVTLLGYTYTPTTGPDKGRPIPVTSRAGAVYMAKLQEVLELIWSAEEAERAAIAGGWVPPEGQAI